ncbi:MAG: nuclease, partial [Actinobacteria bacterium]|nr:nuclease [Actinomycetota bacterium]
DLVIILNELQKKAVITIENKISTQEHSSQLQRYRHTIEHEFKEYEKLYILLSPDVVEPSDNKWLCLTYYTIANIIGELLEYKKDALNPNVYNFIKQYETILRRYLVGNSEIEQICRSIYRKHSKALDLIFQYKPDMNLEIFEYITEILKSSPGIIIDNLSKTYTHFTSEVIDTRIKKVSEGWTKSNRPLLFDFYNSNKLMLYLYIGPCEESYRKQLFDFLSANPELFPLTKRHKKGTKWHAVYLKEFLKKSDFEDATIEDLKPLIDSKWKDFYQKDFVKINEYFEKEWKE